MRRDRGPVSSFDPGRELLSRSVPPSLRDERPSWSPREARLFAPCYPGWNLSRMPGRSWLRSGVSGTPGVPAIQAEPAAQQR